MTVTEKTARQFRSEIMNSFNDFMKDHGFNRTKSKSGLNDFKVVYRNEERYILIGGVLDPADYPYYFYISIGEGSDEMPEADWNAIALWRIMQRVAPDNYQDYLPIFEIHAAIRQEEIEDKAWTARELCKECCSDFLNNDLSFFKTLRSELNRDREARKIFTLDSNGKHKMTYDAQSLTLKEFYS